MDFIIYPKTSMGLICHYSDLKFLDKFGNSIKYYRFNDIFFPDLKKKKVK